MFTTCQKCKKQNGYWESRSLKEPVILNGKELVGAFTYSQYFCPIIRRRVKNNNLPEHQEKLLITDCLNGDREEVRAKPIFVTEQKLVNEEEKKDNINTMPSREEINNKT